ncbi:hypothetical protein HY213_00400 [Candidatus Peregrinibacteria bacterium]|nr:hypothetical protein [Candidatus Peregrinibacteria bacterium]
MHADERLDLRQPDYVDPACMPLRQREGAQKNNHLLRSIFERSEKDFPLPAAQIGRLLATVRWSILHLSRKRFSKATGISANAVALLELEREGHEKKQYHVKTAILRFWEKQGIVSGIREQLLELLEEDRGGGFEGFYRKICIECGVDAFERAAGINIGTLWGREQGEVVPALAEVVRIVRELYAGNGAEQEKKHRLRLEQGTRIWTREKTARYTQRTLEQPLQRLLIGAERQMGSAGETLNGKTMSRWFDLQSKTANGILNGDILPWDAIESIARRVIPAKELGAFYTAWRTLVVQDKKRQSFTTAWERARDEHGWNNQELAYCLNITPPEQRTEGYKKTRKEGFRPSSVIRKMMQANGLSTLAPPRALVDLVCDDDRELTAQLRALFHADRERHYLRGGEGAKGKGLILRIAREFNGVSPGQLASSLRADAADATLLREQIIETERGNVETRFLSETIMQTLLRLTEDLGQKRSEKALNRRRRKGELPIHCQRGTTVAQTVLLLREGMGNYDFLTEAIQRKTGDRSRSMSAPMLRRIAEERACPPLPMLKSLLESCGAEITPETERDWYARFPETLLKEGFGHIGQSRRPLCRLLLTLIHAQEISAKAFSASRFPELYHGTLAKLLRGIEDGIHPAWVQVETVLTAAEVMPGSIPWKLAELLYGNHDDIQAALSQLRPQLARQGLRVEPASLPGLTWKELGGEKKQIPD